MNHFLTIVYINYVDIIGKHNLFMDINDRFSIEDYLRGRWIFNTIRYED